MIPTLHIIDRFRNLTTMACHPSGVTVDIVGIKKADQGRSCEKHEVCGSLLAPDVVVRIREVQLALEVDQANPAPETDALAVYHVSGGIDCCRVGFLTHGIVAATLLVILFGLRVMNPVFKMLVDRCENLTPGHQGFLMLLGRARSGTSPGRLLRKSRL